MTAGADSFMNFELKNDLFMIYGKNTVVGRSFVFHVILMI